MTTNFKQHHALVISYHLSFSNMRSSSSTLVIITLFITFCVLPDMSEAKLEKGGKGRNKHRSIPSTPQGPKLESKSVLENTCSPRKAATYVDPSFVSCLLLLCCGSCSVLFRFQINDVPAWYVPVASKYFYYRWGESLINRSLGASELSNLCMKWLFLGPTNPKGKYHVLVGTY